MHRSIPILLLCMLPLAVAAEEGQRVPWHATWMLEAMGIVVALLIATVLWLVRQILASFIGATVLIVAVFFLLLAFFGRAVGVYDAFLGTTYAYPYRATELPPTPADPIDIRQGAYPLPAQSEGEDIERWDERAPSFEEFFQGNEE